jgi:hypothetical protein
MTKTTYRNAKKEKFTPISNSLLWDKEASLQAKGLLSIFLSNSNDWELNMKEIITRSKNGRDAHYKVVNELIELGYFARVQVVDPVKRQFEEMIYIFSDIKQEVADEIENVKQWVAVNGKDLIIEYKVKKDKKVKKDPFPDFQETEENPIPENQDAEKKDSANQYINNTKGNNTNLNNTNLEEEEKVSPSDLVSFLISKDITLDNALKFETRLLEKDLEGFTYEQVLDAIEWSLHRFLEGKCDEPYIYAVGRLKRVLDGKVKDIANKPMNKTTKKRPVRTEKLPEWFDQEENKEKLPAEPEQTQEEKKQEIEDMLKKLRA